MNRYPVWKYAVILVALLIGAVYTLPNFFGEAPAVQVSSARTGVRIDSAVAKKAEELLKVAGVETTGLTVDENSIKARFTTPDLQLKAKDALEKGLNADAANPSYVVALNLLSRSPHWLSSLRAEPMYLGLDLRGGVHFMLQVDMRAALTQRTEALAGDLRTALRDKNMCGTAAFLAMPRASKSVCAIPPRWKPHAI